MKYRAILHHGDSIYPKHDANDWSLTSARHLRDEFGLSAFFTLSEVQEMWLQYSDDSAASWLNPDKESVEAVFGVKLKEVE